MAALPIDNVLSEHRAGLQIITHAFLEQILSRIQILHGQYHHDAVADPGSDASWVFHSGLPCQRLHKSPVL